MRSWNHRLCEPCWWSEAAAAGEPDRQPVRMVNAEQEKCCLCGTVNDSGIYVRRVPEDMPCWMDGSHDDQ